MPPMAKRSKRAQREHYAAKRGSWNGLSPVTRVVQSKKTCLLYTSDAADD